MVPFADLMTTLVILFLAMYGFASSKQEQEQKKAREGPQVMHEQELAETEEQRRLAEAKAREAALAAELEKAVAERLPKAAAAVRTDADRIQLTLASPLLFESGSDLLRPEFAPFMDQLAAALGSLPNEVLVEGHTDAVPVRGGRFKDNWELSAARAGAVIERLSAGGLDPARLTALGYAHYRPVDTNKTRAGRERNRRIEISLLRTTDRGAP